jgi:hypothetical protein
VEEHTDHCAVRVCLVSDVCTRTLTPQLEGKGQLTSRYGSATLLSIYNKWMFSAEYYNFPFPLFVTACHMVVQFSLAGAVRLIWAHKYRPVERPTRQDYV